MDKPVSATPLRDEFEKLWKLNPNVGDDTNKESSFGLFMAGIYVMLFVVPAGGENLLEVMTAVQTARKEVEAYAKLRKRKVAEQN